MTRYSGRAHRWLASLPAGILPFLLACGTPVGPRLSLQGTWAQQFTFPGSSSIFTLSQHGDSLVGSGSYTIEAGQPGTFTLAGRVWSPADSVRLVFHFASGPDRPFAGRLTDPTHLVGVLTITVPGAIVLDTVSYIRQS